MSNELTHLSHVAETQIWPAEDYLELLGLVREAGVRRQSLIGSRAMTDLEREFPSRPATGATIHLEPEPKTLAALVDGAVDYVQAHQRDPESHPLNLSAAVRGAINCLGYLFSLEIGSTQEMEAVDRLSWKKRERKG